ncbi:GntR family transcriptional regulator [Leucobacter sp. USHLN153]|uniref:GntR family transcriptional regulator n=1 Tax=Leucobacter sp. USHLN153 TaxID=3081268 RepID=UPI003015B0D5
MGDEGQGRLKASERVYRTLLSEIQLGRLAPGTVLGEVEHAERFGVSRTPLREALRKLTADGLVTQVSPRVTVVSALEREDIEALFEVRGALEECAVVLAAARGDVEEFAAIAREFEQVRLTPESGDDELEKYFALIERFDQALDSAVTNEYLISFLRVVRMHLVRVRRMAKTNLERLVESVGEHRLIAEALSKRDADLAVHATHVHLYNARKNTFSMLENERAESLA